MKVADLIGPFFAEHKKLSLQGIGTFLLRGPLSQGDVQEEGDVTQEISFQFDEKASVDVSLIDYLIQHSKKIRPLATSDLESFTLLGNQFLNLGKPFPIPGIGTLQKNKSGKVEFHAGGLIPEKAPTAKTETEDRPEKEISFASPVIKKPISASLKKAAGIGFSLMVIGYLIFFVVKNQSYEKPTSKKLQTDSITIAVKKTASPPSADTIVFQEQTPKQEQPITGFRVVMKTYYNPEKARRFYDRIRNEYNAVVYTSDSLTYKVAIAFSNPISDTTRIKDSLYRILGIPLFIDTVR